MLAPATAAARPHVEYGLRAWSDLREPGTGATIG